MIRPGRTSRGLAALFATDPSAAVGQVIREAGAAVSAIEIKASLRAAGVPELGKRAWDPLQRRLRTDDHVVVEPGYRYRWVADPATPSVVDAFEQIVRAAGGRAKRAHVAVVRQALVEAPNAVETAAHQRQAVLDGVRALAELASEVEELTVNQASARAMIHRVRSRVRRSGLEPIEQAGQGASFDRRRHEAIGPPIEDGAPVIVVRPGYAWKTPHDDVLVARAVVQE
ncbi:MAG: hypothetical protein ACM30G_12790 [Micromonosporaceae bacterium]